MEPTVKDFETAIAELESIVKRLEQGDLPLEQSLELYEAPYFDGRLGLGNIDAKAPLGVLYAQGQNFTFTMNMGSGVRYNFSPRYSISAGLNWMHISNLYLSEPKFANYGINVYGPMFGIDVRLGTPHRRASE